ncbi:MAG: DUF5680 domain-containing protein [Defluviitaleaceae bacterium]|nr:DUF5680 domain-containing protein [Defluviitaleaceae bacterium]
MDKAVVDFYKEAAKAARDAGFAGKIEPSRPNAYDFKYEQGNLVFIDSCLGSGKFAGQMGVWKNEQPVWALNYTGRVVALGFKGDFLNEALAQPLGDGELPVRGTSSYKNGDSEYKCDIKGDLSWFEGREEVYADGKLVFEMIFSGGEIID